MNWRTWTAMGADVAPRLLVVLAMMALLSRHWAYLTPLLVMPNAVRLASCRPAQRVPWCLFAIAATLNGLVCLANHGMPVRALTRPLSADDYQHVAMNAGTRLAFLADIFGKRNLFMFSLGDLLIVVGLVMFAVLYVRRRLA